MSKIIKTIDRSTLPCRYEKHWSESVPYGSTTASFDMSDCDYQGNINIEDADCNNTCPAYQAVDVLMCEKHQREYYDICPDCESAYTIRLTQKENKN